VRSFRDRSAAEPFRFWRAGSREILLDHPIVMGILNLTPDSFSDGGNFLSLDAALDHARMMIEEGADIIDVGGESTRPGATPVSAEDEIARVLPVLKAVSERWPEIPVSIDTTKSRVAAAALEQGADIINDVSAMRLDAEMPIVSARSGAGLVLMHSRGGVADMATYESAIYTDVAGEVLSELGSQILAVEEAGVDRKAIVIDPGFGFSKRTEHSLALLDDLDRFSAYDVPVMVGFSRKRMLTEGDVRAPFTIEQKDEATARLNGLALERGAIMFRVHNVGVTRRALDDAWKALTLEG